MNKENSRTGARHISTDDARGGSTPHIVRYVLAVSLGLIILIFAIMLLVSMEY